MRLGVDARFACSRYDGVGRYVAALTRELATLPAAPRCVVVTPPRGEDRRHPLPNQLPVIEPRWRPESPWAQLEMARLLGRQRLDVWHAPYPLLPPVVRSTPVVTLHDCIIERHPRYLTPLTRLLYRSQVRQAIRRARLVVVASAASAADAGRFYQLPESRIRLIPMGVDPAPAADPSTEAIARRRLGVGEGYLLLVGRPRPHKRFSLAIRALASLPADRRPSVVQVGRPDPRLPDDHREVAAQLGVELISLCSLTESQLWALYRGAALVAMPSAIEGFGLPVLEALAAGTPVLATDIQPFRHSGGDVARYVAGDVEAWTLALDACLDDRAWRDRTWRAGPLQAASFSWRQVASSTLRVYQEVA